MYTLLEQSDVFVDAAASDHRSQLLFVSVYGRDTSIQQFMARLHQGSREGGIDDLTVCDHESPSSKQSTQLQVLVGDPKRLQKLTGRMPRTGLLGNLVHAWIFDPSLLEIDHTAHAAWLFRQAAKVDQAAHEQLELEATWRLVQELSPVPLLSHWCVRVLAYLQSRRCLVKPLQLGPLSALRIEVPEGFADWVSERVQDGDFRETASAFTEIHADERPVINKEQRHA